MQKKCKCCKSTETLVENTTNFAKEYYCTNCEAPVDRMRIVCPWCDDRSDVRASPVDNWCTYHCYNCEGEFNNINTFFGSETIQYGSNNPLSMVANELPEDENHYKVKLVNTGEKTVTTQGRQPIVLQYHVVDSKWVTFFGNPESYVPVHTTRLRPGEHLEWEFGILHSTIRSDITLHESIFNHRDRLPQGTYRTVYWGAVESLPAVKFEIEYPF